MNVYHCVHREKVELYLSPLVDNLLLNIIEKESENKTIREEDKKFISQVYSYIFIGIMLDWIGDDMKQDPQQIVERLAKLIKGSISEAIDRFAL